MIRALDSIGGSAKGPKTINGHMIKDFQLKIIREINDIYLNSKLSLIVL